MGVHIKLWAGSQQGTRSSVDNNHFGCCRHQGTRRHQRTQCCAHSKISRVNPPLFCKAIPFDLTETEIAFPCVMWRLPATELWKQGFLHDIRAVDSSSQLWRATHPRKQQRAMVTCWWGRKCQLMETEPRLDVD
ncbi:hypothetical protein O6H91_03G071400 [Diphasiastrum complanatum]|uniref:Uncharacterized protein n=1 Tax=Diphasiastrum complanatum TaxID=34168 RepID=A0ACC2E7A0_DIPCM|nr:hypothetical protein O6H91_03G071400 [Diphasiastrum complanatum]